ncbi:MAG: hypothetical protein ABS43_23360 [Bordetella sp. SCN 67-23]|nr:hypothetical protein [Burkholderiales bacterium]ODS70222.1 MAG: hypothetical protein ABS43_23360 [Bordetella sp. SCN 67-23]OJW92353.1 MAG: hypothetical protein BGO71_07635 [Burkholderiales bacterium 67-32]
MAEILALGISHYPPLSGRDEQMSSILKGMLKNPELPESLRSPQGWPAGMQEEWGDDEGTASAGRHRGRLVAEMRRVRAELDAFNPDFVLIWGDDQHENFREDVVPPFCVCAHPSFEFHPRAVNNVWDEPLEQTFHVPGHQAAGKALVKGLIEAEFDVAYSYKPLHHPLGHAFTNAIFYLDYDRKGFPYPILPITVNSYGRKVICQRGSRPRFDRKLTEDDLDPPAPTPRRLFDLGGEIARILAASPWRVAILASSGWSHAFLSAKTHLLYPDTQADLRLYEALRSGDYQTWRDYPASAIEDSGQQEVLNWSCLAGALHALDRKPRETVFIDTWIFNSSKVFLIAPPV